MTTHSAAPRHFAVLATLIFIASVLPKTFIFAGNEPVLINYAVATVSLVLAAALLLQRANEIPVDKVVGGLLIVAIIWATISATQSSIPLNLLAAAAFAITSVGFGLILPALIYVSRREPAATIRDVLAVMTIVSALLLIGAPELAVDPESGRIAGVYVSVAVSSSMFGFSALLALHSALVSKKQFYLWMWSGVALASLALLYLTRTRSSLVEVLAAALVILTFTPLARGPRLVVMSLTALLLVGVVAGAAIVSTGIIAIDQQLAQFRLADSDLSAARGGNWNFGIERILAQPLFGEGLLAKQTQGGTSPIDFSGPTSYDPLYDPHSLLLSFGVEGGVPFMLLMTALFVLIPVRFVQAFGWRTALQTPEFVIASSRLVVSIFSGGDMTTLGNAVEKTIWILLGTIMLKAELKLRSDRRIRATGQPHAQPPWQRKRPAAPVGTAHRG